MIAYDRCDGARSRRLMAKPFAVKLSEIGINDDDRITAIVVDCDLPPVFVYDAVFDITHLESAAAIAWLGVRSSMPPPNLVIVNRQSLRAHIVWLLQDPIHFSTQPKAPRYAKAIQRALTRLIPGGDLAYSWGSATVHNPWDAVNNDVSSHRSKPYHLRELSAFLDLENERSVKTSRYHDVVNQLNFQQGSRNQSMHEALAAYARATLNSGKKITSDRLWEEAFRLNAFCAPALGDGELKGLVSSKLRYWGGRRPRDRADELKRKRAAEGRTLALVRTQPMEERRKRAREMRAARMTIAEISRALEIGERTVYRYVARMSLETLIDVIREQDIPGKGGVSSALGTEIARKTERDGCGIAAGRANPPATVRRSRRRRSWADDHETICACGCQDRTGGGAFAAAFGTIADTS